MSKPDLHILNGNGRKHMFTTITITHSQAVHVKSAWTRMESRRLSDRKLLQPTSGTFQSILKDKLVLQSL